MLKPAILLCTLSIAPGLWADEFAQKRDQNWHQWRGPRADGVAPRGDPPLNWDEQTNIRWKVEIPGEGSATPIVWDDRLFVLSAIKTDRIAEMPPVADATAKTQPPTNYYQFVVLCLDRSTGEERWRQVAFETVPSEGRHPTNTYASGSPSTDGRYVYASFGSRGIACYDLDGNLVWRRNLDPIRTRFGWGEGNSAVLYGDSLIVNQDGEDQSFIAALDAASGETRWKVDRDEPTTWATPLVLDHHGRVQVIVNGTNRVRGYDLATGEVIWQCGGQTVNAIPSPLALDNVVYCMSGYRGAAAFAIPLDSVGDITGTDKILWSWQQGTPYVPSPIIYDGHMYFTAANTDVLSCLDVSTGKPVFERSRLSDLGTVYASPVAAAGRIYFTGREGATVVIHPGNELKVLATNKLDDGFDASPAIAGTQIFMRGSRHLYCIDSNAGPLDAETGSLGRVGQASPSERRPTAKACIEANAGPLDAETGRPDSRVGPVRSPRRPSAGPPLPLRSPPANEPLKRALAYLSREVPQWPATNRCYSCHNNGDAARALYAAMRLGFEIAPDTMNDTTRWLSQPEDWGKNGGDGISSDKKLATIQFSAALMAANQAGAISEWRPLVTAAAMVSASQEPDGSWTVDAAGTIGSPVTYGTVLATATCLRTLEGADTQRFSAQIDKARHWLRTQEPKTVLDSAATLLGLAGSTDEAAIARRRTCLALLRQSQSKSGGWGPFVTAPPEPFDTAVVLLALSAVGEDIDWQAIEQGRGYLIACQLDDGGWPETTRPSSAVSYAQHISTSAWATLALLATMTSEREPGDFLPPLQRGD